MFAIEKNIFVLIIFVIFVITFIVLLLYNIQGYIRHGLSQEEDDGWDIHGTHLNWNINLWICSH